MLQSKLFDSLREKMHKAASMVAAVAVLIVVNAFGAVSLQAQNVAVKGTVMSNGESVIGASVIVKGTTNGTITDIDGHWSLSVPSDAVLVISSVGYETLEVNVAGRSVVDVTLNEESLTLNDVVVVGYGVQKKVNLTGAVSSVSTEELSGKPIANVIEGLQGTTPGLIIQQGSSYPGSAPSINIRGNNTMNDNNPLVLIDGVEGTLANVNPNDIESISVLKDASSTAIYGSRASNGVLLVTTKKGSEGRVEVSYNMTAGVQTPTCLPTIVNSWEYAELYNEAAVNSGRETKFSAEEIAAFKNGGTNVNWVRELYKPATPMHTHNLSVTGGTEKLSYLASIGYVNQQSMFKGPNYGYDRFNGRLNLSHKVTKNLTVGVTAQYTRNILNDHAYWTEWIIEQCNRMPPIYPIKDENGKYTYPSGSNSNSLQRLEEGGYRRSDNDEALGTLTAEYRFLEHFKINAALGGRILNNRTHENRKGFEGTGDTENHISESTYNSTNLTSNITAGYNQTFGQHTVGALVGFSYEGLKEKSFNTQRVTEDSRYDIFVGGESGDNVSNGAGATDWSLYSVFARINYNYAERYLLEVNLRNDYSSYFAKNNRSGLFPSVSAGWRISQEKWYEPAKKIASSMKLRASYGLVGNNRIGAYQYMSGASIVNNWVALGGQMVPHVNFTEANEAIKWETTRMADIGFDIGFLKDNLTVTFDYFHNTTSDILVRLETPGIYGAGNPVQNAAKVRTYGWELAVNYHFNTGIVNHHIGGNVSDSQNRVIDTKGTEIIGGYDVNTIIREGYPLWSYYAFKSDGYFQNEEECLAGPHLEGVTPKPGDIRYIDKNGDGVIKTDDDRFIVGSDQPRYIFGFNYGLEVKGFFVSVFLQGVGKRSKWMRGESVEAFHNNNEGPILDFHKDRWTPANPNASYPRITMGSENANNAAKSDFWIKDAKYLRIKNIQFGYTFQKDLLEKMRIKQLQIYGSVENAATFSSMPGGWDPEYTADGSGRAYPVARVFSLGLNFKF